MIFSGKRIELHQPNDTVRRLMCELIVEQGGEVVDAQDASAPCADLLLHDLEHADASDVGARPQIYLDQEQPVIFTGLRHQRETLMTQPHWVERPFSMDALRVQCMIAMGEDVVDERVLEHSETVETKERDRPRIEAFSTPITREFDDASILEEEFGLEPGVLGGKSEDEQPLLDVTVLTELPMMDPPTMEMDSEALLDPDMQGGVVRGVVATELIKEHRLVRPMPLSIEPIAPSIELRSAKVTQPHLPAVRAEATSVQLPSHGLTTPSEPLVESSGLHATSSGMSTAVSLVDDETSRELRGFSRMLAGALGKLTLNSRVDDRFEHINRALHALFARGLDGAAEELQRIPQAQGFSGHLRSLSLMGVFHTIRDRRLRGKLEVSSADQAYILYVEGRHLYEIDALVGDHEQLLLQILSEHKVIDDASYQRVLAEREAQGALGASVEMMLRQEGLLGDAALKQAIGLRAMEIFRRACQVRDGQFAFIEISPGDAMPWPVRDLGLDVDELLLELLRQDAVETGISEATASAHLMPNTGRVLGLPRGALTLVEREVLEIFEGGESLEIARKRLGHLGRELDGVINRLKRAQLLLRVKGSPQMLRSNSAQHEAVSRSQEGRSTAHHTEGKTRSVSQSINLPLIDASSRSEQTVVAQLDARELDARSTREERAVTRAGIVAFPVIGEEEFDEVEIPTLSVKGHMVEPSLSSSDDEDEELDRLLGELTGDES